MNPRQNPFNKNLSRYNLQTKLLSKTRFNQFSIKNHTLVPIQRISPNQYLQKDIRLSSSTPQKNQKLHFKSTSKIKFPSKIQTSPKKSENKSRLSKSTQKIDEHNFSDSSVHQPNFILQLLQTKYLLYKHITLTKYRIKTAIEEIYNQNFEHNTYLLKNQKMNYQLEKKYGFGYFVNDYYIKKYKDEELGEMNLINLICSLLEINRKKNEIIFSMFIRFIEEVYTYQDLLYFLFIRNLAEHCWKIQFYKLELKNQMDMRNTSVIVKRKQIKTFIKSIMGKEIQSVDAFYYEIIKKIKDQYIEIYALFQILINHFHQKNSKVNIKLFQNTEVITKQVESIFVDQNQPTNQQEHETQQIQNTIIKEDQKSYNTANFELDFWIGKQINEFNIKDDLQKLILSKMEKKVNDLVDIMTSDQSINTAIHQKLYQLILKKSYNLINCVFNMDKLEWFRELRISNPNLLQLQYIQNIQMMIQKLRNNPQNKLLSDFCKQILTVQQLKRAIQKIIIN